MTPKYRPVSILFWLIVPFLFSNQTGAAQRPAEAAKSAQAKSEKDFSLPAQELFRGKVVSLRESLTRHKIESREEFDKQVVLETPEGNLIPIVPDWRGRAFFQDKRLRNRNVELVGKRQKGVPYLQVLMIFTFDEQGNRQYTDYYCDTCGFAMYELLPCQCCQGPLRLRFERRDLPKYIKAGASKAPASDSPSASTTVPKSITVPKSVQAASPADGSR